MFWEKKDAPYHDARRDIVMVRYRYTLLRDKHDIFFFKLLAFNRRATIIHSGRV